MVVNRGHGLARAVLARFAALAPSTSGPLRGTPPGRVPAGEAYEVRAVQGRGRTRGERRESHWPRPQATLSPAVRPTATCGENRLVGRTSSSEFRTVRSLSGRS